jgi:transketolase
MAVDISFLEHQAYELRRFSLLATTKAGSGHLTSCLSAADLVAALFFHAMQFDACNPDKVTNDRFILSKGHAAPVLYAAWALAGVISEEELLTLRQFDSVLEGHPTPRFKYTEAATGSLGQGLSIGLGFGLSARLGEPFYTYVLMGDSEVSEGSIWEAAELASYYKLDNVIALLDVNRLGQSGQTMSGHHVDQYSAKFVAFGWHVIVVDGHDMAEIVAALDVARTVKYKPTIIIAKTYKGYGLSLVEDKEGFHGKALPALELPVLLKDLADRFPQAAAYKKKLPVLNCQPAPTRSCQAVQLPVPTYKKDALMATRKAYGQALTALGAVSPQVVALDAEVKNSTYAELFEQAFPERFFQCFIAEQNMVSMGVGFNKLGHIPFISTFGVFFTRAYDQIRLAAIGRAALRLVGSHAGVSIGEDGPSQMALEDIAIMRALPASIVLYPSDAVSTYKLVNIMTNYHAGISYLRTTRSETPVIYDNSEEFQIGGMKVVRTSDYAQVTILAAGITLFEAISAHQALKQAGINSTVIDCYSIKPLDVTGILAEVKKTGNKLVVVEDHYLEGGLGEAVAYALRNHDITISCLAVTKLPRSGSPEALRRFEEIDATAIVEAAKVLVEG